MQFCWICGAAATTAEHRTKKSDVRAVFGRLDPNSPLRLHNALRKNIPVRSLDAKPLKARPSLCAHCNNVRTQPHDRAWERLSCVLRKRIPRMAGGQTLGAHTVFPAFTKQEMKNVHLFFAKLFGTYLIEHDERFDVSQFAHAILNDTVMPELYLKFGHGADFGGAPMTGASNMHVLFNHPGRTLAFATWFYCVEPIAVNLMFSVSGEKRRGLRNSWHPKSGNQLVIADFRKP